MTNDIAKAVQILKEGYLVAFPTETVYGLGADATNWTAIRRIFEAKGRPPTNPLIIHVADISMANRYVTHWPAAAQLLAEKFWPGALTLILPKSPQIDDAVTAGRNTVGVRVPNHPLALALLKAFDGPLAAPSANRSTRISPTTVNHVYIEGVIRGGDYVLDGGPCQIGIESTILDLTSTPPTILRPGAITLQQIQSVIGAVQLRVGNADPNMAASSPGQQEVHYAPAAQAIRFEKSQFLDIQKWEEQNSGGGWITIGSGAYDLPDEPGEYARLFYSRMREIDDAGPDFIFIEMPPDTPEWLAVRDRLLRATRPFPPQLP